MKKKLLAVVFVVVFAVCFSAPAFAWKNVRIGKWNFEKAWMAYVMLKDDMSTEYFKAAADSFGKALAADPPSRTARFVSNLTMAGISFYMAGRYAECIDAMTMAYRTENSMWEANLYIGLAWARQGNKNKAVTFFKKYLESMPSQRTLSDDVAKQLDEMAQGVTTLNDAASSIAKAAQLQFIRNISLNFSPHSLSPPQEQCSGAYWWRRNNAPCSSPDSLRN